MQQYVPGREARRFSADQIYSEIDFYVDIRGVQARRIQVGEEANLCEGSRVGR